MAGKKMPGEDWWETTSVEQKKEIKQMSVEDVDQGREEEKKGDDVDVKGPTSVAATADSRDAEVKANTVASSRYGLDLLGRLGLGPDARRAAVIAHRRLLEGTSRQLEEPGEGVPVDALQPGNYSPEEDEKNETPTNDLQWQEEDQEIGEGWDLDLTGYEG